MIQIGLLAAKCAHEGTSSVRDKCGVMRRTIEIFTRCSTTYIIAHFSIFTPNQAAIWWCCVLSWARWWIVLFCLSPYLSKNSLFQLWKLHFSTITWVNKLIGSGPIPTAPNHKYVAIITITDCLSQPTACPPYSARWFTHQLSLRRVSASLDAIFRENSLVL